MNLSGIGRTLRIVAGSSLIMWALLGGPVWAWAGALPLATGTLGFCPLYPLIGIGTRGSGKEA